MDGDRVADRSERQRLRAGYAARAARNPWFRWRYHRRLRRERRGNSMKHLLLAGAMSVDDLDRVVAGRPEIGSRVTRTLPDGRIQYYVAILDYNP